MLPLALTFSSVPNGLLAAIWAAVGVLPMGTGTTTVRQPREVSPPAEMLTAVTHTVWLPGWAASVIAKPGFGPVICALTTSGRDTAVTTWAATAPSSVARTVSGSVRLSGSAAQPWTLMAVDPVAITWSRYPTGSLGVAAKAAGWTPPKIVRPAVTVATAALPASPKVRERGGVERRITSRLPGC